MSGNRKQTNGAKREAAEISDSEWIGEWRDTDHKNKHTDLIAKNNKLACSAGPDLAGGRPGPSGVFRISERDWLANYRVLKIEEFGGRPLVGGRPGARGPPALPPKSGPAAPLRSYALV